MADFARTGNFRQHLHTQKKKLMPASSSSKSLRMQTRIGSVDDHQLFLKSLTLILESFGEYLVVVEALKGMDLQEKMKSLDELPELMLIDVEMPQMDGVETATR